MTICMIETCIAQAKARGLCFLHYARLQKQGKLPPLQPRQTEHERFWDRVEVVPGCCWTWRGGRSNGGYGWFYRDDRRMESAHRYAWELLVGPIPEGLQLDHLCRVRLCVNPDHLEPVTCAENLRRGYSVTALNARKTLCIRGHDNWYFRLTGGRLCRTCQNDQRRARRVAS